MLMIFSFSAVCGTQQSAVHDILLSHFLANPRDNRLHKINISKLLTNLI